VSPVMSGGTSLTLYRKHRPMAFDELVGQPAVVTGLQAAVAGGRVAHAYLFAGPRGTGKTSAARILAKCLNCLQGGPRPDPCGACEACLAIAAGTAFDVVEIDAASNRGINEIRELRERVKYAPAQFRTKVYIVDEVHMLTTEAFNALLKTLEEPPDNVVFVLATTEPAKVPQTILSRCQRYEFHRLGPGDIERRLTEVARREGVTLTPGAAVRIAFLADGALRDALVLLEQARGFAGDGVIDEAVLDAAFGEPVADVVEKAAEAVAQGDARLVLEAVAAAVTRGADPAWMARELLRWFRLALIAQVSPELLQAEVAPETARRVEALAGRMPRTRILAVLRNLSEAIAQRYSAQPRIDLELALLRVVMPADELSLTALSDRLRAIEERLEVAPSAGRAAGAHGAGGPSQARGGGASGAGGGAGGGAGSGAAGSSGGAIGKESVGPGTGAPATGDHGIPAVPETRRPSPARRPAGTGGPGRSRTRTTPDASVQGHAVRAWADDGEGMRGTGASAAPVVDPVAAQADDAAQADQCEAQPRAGAPESLTLAKLTALWPQVKSAVKERSKPCYGHLENATIVDAGSGRVTLGLGNKFNRDLLAEPAMLNIVAEAIREVAGIPVAVECIVTAARHAQPAAAAPMPDAGAFALAEAVLGNELL
jgi:DNA polymerase-3 subunit gamma/tau